MVSLMEEKLSFITCEFSTIVDVAMAPERLKQLQLDMARLLKVVERVRGASGLVTKNSTSNAAGTKAYLEGPEALRDEFIGDYWECTKDDHLEGIFNKHLNVKVLFQNVDVACVYHIDPRARSPKGAASLRACLGNSAKVELPLSKYMDMPPPQELEDLSKVYYLMVDQEGSAELSQPIIKAKQFDKFVERIFLVKVNPSEGSLIKDEPEEEIPMDEIEMVFVTKK